MRLEYHVHSGFVADFIVGVLLQQSALLQEMRELAEEGERKLMERINSREADVRHNSSEGQSVPEKSLSELMQEEAERDDE